MSLSNISKYTANQLETKGKKLVAFAFDDAPNGPTTISLLNLFYENSAHCTFMLSGVRLTSEHSSLLKGMINAGMELGNHSYEHTYLTKMSEQEIFNDISKLQDLVKDLTDGYIMKVARLPMCTGDDKVYKVFKEQLKLPIFSGVDTNNAQSGPLWDFRPTYTSEKFVDCVRSSIIDGAVYVCHNMPNTLNAMKILIPELKSYGYEFVTLSELIDTRNVEVPLGVQIRSISPTGEIVYCM